jgi:HlyD family secretion protein
MKTTFYLFLLLPLLLLGCKSNDEEFDAQGTFEADEVIVSSELSGKIRSLEIEEGSTIAIGDTVGTIDAANISLQKDQVIASIEALNEKTLDVSPQVKLLEEQLQVQQLQLKNLLHEQDRIEKLFSQDAATGKQRDDIHSQVEVLQKQMAVTRQQIQVQKRNTATQNRGILSEGKPLQKRIAQLDDQLSKSSIINPVTGTILTKYAEQGEITAPGKALYKIADLSTIILRAYISGKQLPQVKLGQQVKVYIDQDNDEYKEYAGTIQWISDKAEFTPKTIQTKEERANLVYAIRIAVKNDGYLKIGMYGEVRFK